MKKRVKKMSEKEIIRRANKIASPHSLQAEILPGIHSVGVGGDARSYTPVVVLTGPFPGWDVISTVATAIWNTLPVNRVTYETAKKE